MNNTNKKKLNKGAILPILLCWLAYASAYVGRNTYSSSIILIKEYYSVSSDAEIALATTLFFFVYGAGQLVNGIFCKKYNQKYLISLSLIVSSMVNATIYLGVPFKFIKYLWLLNGVAQSFLWTSLVYLLSKTLKEKDLSKAVIAMGTTVATGTFVVYGVSSLFAIWQEFKYTFLFASIVMTLVAIFWLLKYDVAFISQREEETKEQVVATKKGSLGVATIILILVLGLFSIINNLVKDGVATWTPSILKDTFSLPDSVSIILSLVLPAFGIFSAVINVLLQKKVKSFILQAGIWYFLAVLAFTIIILFIDSSLWFIVLLAIAIASLFMHCVNNVLTSIAPLFLRDKINSGALAGLLNCCCYVGSTISTYCLASIKDATGNWSSSFVLLLGLCAFAVVIAGVYTVIDFINKKKQKNNSLS